MNNSIMPLNCIRQWQYRKYKAAFIPIFIILAGFVLKMSKIEIPYIQILLAVALVAYIVVLFIYRLGNPTIPMKDDVMVSPVHGKIEALEKANEMVKIRITKSVFDPIELRCPFYIPELKADSELVLPYGSHELEMNFGDKTPYLFNEHGRVTGSLLGLLPGKYTVTIRFNENILNSTLNLKKGDIVKAGETVLAEFKTQPAKES